MVLLIVLLILFLLLLIALGFASIKLFGARDDKGSLTAPGCLGGCAIAGALAVIGVLGLAAFVAAVVAISSAESFRRATKNLPELKIGAWRDHGAHIRRVEGFPLHLVLEWKGHSDPTEALLHKLEEAGAGGDILVTAEYMSDENGEPVTVVDLALRASERDAQGLEQALREIRPDLDLSQGIQVILRKVEEEQVR